VVLLQQSQQQQRKGGSAGGDIKKNKNFQNQRLLNIAVNKSKFKMMRWVNNLLL
jgi:hypothetical protein